MLKSEYNLTRSGTIGRWDEGLALGNGDLGALIFGEEHICFSLDKSNLWDNRPAPETLENNFNYANMIALVKSGEEEDWQEFLRIFNDCVKHSTPTKLNAGKIVFHLAPTSATQFSLNIAFGEACVSEGNKSIKSFVCADKKVGVALLDEDVTFSVEFPEYYYRKEVLENGKVKLRGLGYERPTVLHIENIVAYVHQNGESYFGIAYSEKRMGEKKQLFYYVFNEPTEQKAIDDIKDAFSVQEKSYDELFERHKLWWQEFWAESSISIPDKKMERAYYLSQYLFGSGNRADKFPMPLQGLWTASDGNLPPWKGDYHHDLNTEMTYWSYLRSNHIQTGKSFVEYLWNYKSEFETFTKKFFGVEGLLIPSASSITGQPIGGWPMYSYSPTVAIWVAKAFDDYYQYTGDEGFFSGRAYPFFKRVGDAISGLLYEKDGKLYLPLSSSPEYNGCEKNAFMEWSNFDLQLVRYLYETLIVYAKKAGDDITEYEKKLAKLDGFYINQDKVLMVSNVERVEYTHRHHSNLLCIYPLQTLKADCKDNEEIIEENIKRLEELGYGWWVGYSFAWFASICCMNKSANRALFALQIFYRCYLADNGFHLNGDFKKYGVSLIHYRPFTLEANYAYCDAVHNMLIQDHLGYIELFPCVPDDWKDEEISFENLRAKNGVLISATYKNGSVEKLKIQTAKPQEIRIKNTFGKEKILFSNGKEIACKIGEIFSMNAEEAWEVVNENQLY